MMSLHSNRNPRTLGFRFAQGDILFSFDLAPYPWHWYLLTQSQISSFVKLTNSLRHAFLISFNCWFDTAHGHLRREYLVRDCPDQIDLWRCLGNCLDSRSMHEGPDLCALHGQPVLGYVRELAEHELVRKAASRILAWFLLFLSGEFLGQRWCCMA